ncbi:sensor histidine kinase [Liquorilactobacillus capillatus]|uniref:histidine kinase n=1 Tax=Liquorilactobacillus capillatus DSM 19910 TaxID=1423731 RepID=A0A0R1LY15_9LACO|nr:sensor histidine kinase [Liquorilactobacillus capillatus]KRL00511.1 signal transduction histidine kinase [Liquorilactobacillus capillatus DSM 19910]
MIKNNLKLILKIFVFEWPNLVIYLLFLFLFYFICILYKINLNVIGDLVRYTIIPFFMIIGFQVYQKYVNAKSINKLIREENFEQIHLHGFYGRLYSHALRNFMEHKLTENRNLILSLKRREDYLTLWSHEMKTPLTSLLMIAENNPTVSSEEVSEKLELVNYQLKQLLTFDRLDDFNNDLEFEKVNLSDCIRKIIQQDVSFFLSHEVMPKITVPSVKILTDLKWLSFILEQVIINAVKYSDKNGIVQINFNDDTLTITDHGIGIAKADLPRVFEQGFTGSNGRTHGEATGMGLYMTQKIAKILDVKVEISSTKNVGTIFKFVFDPQKITIK